MSQENPMPERVNSFVPLLLAVLFVFVATITVPVDSPARADSACIEQPSQPAAEGTRWIARNDRAKGRRCWFLVDANGRDITAPQAQPSAAPTPEPTLSSQLATLLGNLTGASTTVAPQGNPPQTSPANPARKPQGNAANASKTDNAGRADQRSIGEGHAVKRASPVLPQPERDALFEEFLRWRESQQSISTLAPWPSSR
jgi:hypothetical protein